MPDLNEWEFEIDGVIHSAKPITDEDWNPVEMIPYTEEELASQDPEGWRKYADVIDAKQINWLFKNPQYLSSDTIRILRLRHPQKLSAEQHQWIDEHPDWEGDGDGEED